MSSTEILKTVIDVVVNIYGINSPLFSNFITANKSLLSPLLLAFLFGSFEKFKYLLETTAVAYSKKPNLLFDYMTQGEALEQSVFKQPSLLSLIVNWPGNTTAFLDLLLDIAQRNFLPSKFLFFDYLSFKNSKGVSMLHLAVEDSVDNCRFFLEALSHLIERSFFLALLDQRDYYGLTPLLTTWRYERKALSMLLQEYGASPYVRPYEWMNKDYLFQASLKNFIGVGVYHLKKISFYSLIAKKITENSSIFIDSFISSSVLPTSTLEAYKESIFYFTVFMLKHSTLQNLIHLVFKIRDKEEKNRQLNLKEKQIIYYYQKIIDSFYHFLKTDNFPFFSFQGYK